MSTEQLTQPIGELLPPNVLQLVTQQSPELTLDDIEDPAELWAVTRLSVPENNPKLAEQVMAIRGIMLFECMREQPGNERYVALLGLKRSIDTAYQARSNRNTVDDDAGWLTTAAQA